jgi:hypothetical protein
MTADRKRLQRLLEQVTAAVDAPASDLDPHAQSLREAWLGFGHLLEAAKSAAYDVPLPLGEWLNLSPLPLGEGQRVRVGQRVTALPRRRRARRWLLSAAALVAASLLIAVVATWTPWTTEQTPSPSPVAPQTAAIKAPGATLVQQQGQTVRTPAEPQWDDSLDEQIAQVGQQLTSAQESQLSGTDEFALVQDRIEQFRQEVQADSL